MRTCTIDMNHEMSALGAQIGYLFIKKKDANLHKQAICGILFFVLLNMSGGQGTG